MIRAKGRDPQTKKLTPYLTGDIFFYAVGPIVPPLPKSLNISGTNCLVIHDTQTNFCERCKKVGHQTSDSIKCPLFEKKNITCVKSPSNPLCNYYMHDMSYKDMIFPSSEHCYQWKKATDLQHPGIATKVLNAKTPEEAKQVTREIDNFEMEVWSSSRLEVMEDILSAKLSSDDSFKSALLETKDSDIVECTNDKFWGSGLSIYLSKTTKQYPGLNNLGYILMKIRTELLTDISNQSESNKDIDITTQNQSKQTEIDLDSIPKSNSDIASSNTSTNKRMSRTKHLLSSQHRASSLPTMDRFIEVNPPKKRLRDDLS